MTNLDPTTATGRAELRRLHERRTTRSQAFAVPEDQILGAAVPTLLDEIERAEARIAPCQWDGKPCYVAGDDPHWRCGTVQCGRDQPEAETVNLRTKLTTAEARIAELETSVREATDFAIDRSNVEDELLAATAHETRLRDALIAYQGFALDAFRLLDADQDSKTMKLLRAMAGDLPGYRHDVDDARAALAQEETPDAG